MPRIDVADISLTFGEGRQARRVLDHVSFGVADGECFGLVGEFGSGKSSILRCLAGLYDHWTGAITIEGAPLPRHLTRARCRMMQMVFQDPYASLHPRHMIDTTLREPLRIWGIGNAEARIAEAMARVGLDPRLRYAFPNALSGGQRQRVAIARALLLEPHILLLDEPTSALDVSIQAEILNLLVALRRERSLTCILVSHDLAVVSHLCERLAVLREGRVEEILSRDDLVARRPATDYTRELIAASGPYRRVTADTAHGDATPRRAR